jgi:hypothetical protein
VPAPPSPAVKDAVPPSTSGPDTDAPPPTAEQNTEVA